MTKYFYSLDGVTTAGPVTSEELKEMHTRREINDFSLCSSEKPEAGIQYHHWFPIVYLDDATLDTNTQKALPGSMVEILRRFEGAIVAANLTSPSELEAVWLSKVGDDYFSIRPRTATAPVHLPLKSMLSLREWPTDVSFSIHRPVDRTIKRSALGKMFHSDVKYRKPEFMKVELTAPLVLEVYHNPVYRGGAQTFFGTGVGFSLPLS